MKCYTAKNTVIKCFNHFLVFLKGRCCKPPECSAIGLRNDHILCDIYEAAGEVTGISSFKCSICKTLTRTVSGNEILKYRKPFFKVGQDRILDDLSTGGTGFLRFRHQSPHTGKLTDLLLGSPRTGVKHHINRVETLIILGEYLHQCMGELTICMCPDINDLVITFVVGDETHVVVIHHFVNLSISTCYEFGFGIRDQYITQVKRQTSLECHLETGVLDIIQELSRCCSSCMDKNITDNIPQRFLGQQLVDVWITFRHFLVEEYLSN